MISLIPEFQVGFFCVSLQIESSGAKTELTKYTLGWAEQSLSALGREMACDEEGPRPAAGRAGTAGAWVLLQHRPCSAAACCGPKKAERGLCCLKRKVGVCPSSRGGSQGGTSSRTGSDAHSHACGRSQAAVTFTEREEGF